MVNNIYSNLAAKSAYSNNNSKIPAVPDLLTSGQSGSGDSKFEEKIMDLARKDAAAGKNSKFTESGKGMSFKVGTDEWHKLRNDYISTVSPDRKGIITNTLSNLANRMSSMQIKFNRANFFQVLFKNSGLFGSNDIGSNFIRFRDASGNEIAFYSEYQGWVTIETPAEQSRRQDFNVLWDEAISKAQREINIGANTSVGITNGGVDIKA